MIPIDIAIEDDGLRLPLRTSRATAASLTRNAHGVQSVTLSVPMSALSAYDLITRSGADLRATLTAAGAQVGARVEDVAIDDTGATLTALGDWRAFSDVPYTSLLSDTSLDRWRPLEAGEAASSLPYRFTFDIRDDIVIAANNNSSQSSTVIGFVGYEPPDGTTRNPTAIQCDITLGAPAANWQTAVQSRDATWTTGVNHFLLSTAGAGTLTRSVCLLIPAAARLDMFLRFNAAAATFAGQTGDAYVKLSNIRVVSALWVNTTSAALVTAGAAKVITPGSMDNIAVGSRLRINDTDATTEIVVVTAITSTTFTATFANGYSAGFRIQASHVETSLTAGATAGSSVTLTVGSTARMYVGQRLIIASGGSTSESVVVTSITSATQVVVATLVTNQSSGATVQALALYGDQVARVLLAGTLAANPTALSSSSALIQSPGVDLANLVYEDADIAAALVDLAAAGSAQQSYEVGVDDSRRLYFRPQGDMAQAWYVDAASLQVQRSLEELVNSAYGVYQAPSGRTLRTAAVTDAASVTQFAVTRRQAVSVSTTNSTLATQAAQATVDGAANPPPRASITFNRVYTAQGAVAPLWQVREGDTITIRNLPITAGPVLDQVRTFRIAETTYDLIADTLSIVPAAPLPDLPHQLAAAIAR